MQIKRNDLEEYNLFFVDAFTDIAFKGNPAAVCLLNKQITEITMQKIAFEIGYSETCFVLPQKENKNTFYLRWFTPETEVSLCGHGTLSTAYVLWKQFNHLDDILIFHTKSGVLKATKQDDYIVLDFPINIVKSSDKQYIEITKALGLNIQDTIYYQSKESGYLLSEVDYETLLTLNPDFDKLKQIDIKPFTSVILTAKGDEEYDFFSRCFAVWEGIDEDSVTGSAHTVLIDYWKQRLPKKHIYKAFQCSPRGGELLLEININRVYIYGKAVLTMKGFLCLTV
ncbi:MAG: PhzF family phenazine biosynthesis protein [Candidatus Cloacimonetes bacterium]|nr:PhzF family phenazine biosynthesis protein [Candidatus Cloacimonadota bacterium]